MQPTPLQVLLRSEKPEQVTHEIILVHGFKTVGRNQSRSVECRQILKSWVTQEAKRICNWVNVRSFGFDSAHVLHNGNSAISEAAIDLCNGLAVTKDPSSPLFCSDRNRDRGRSSRAAIFVAHGIGTWIVKEVLILLKNEVNRIDPTGLFFFDIPATSPVDVPPHSAFLWYLHDYSEIFKMQLEQEKMFRLQSKLHHIDSKFQSLATTLYGKCEQIRQDNTGSFSYTAITICGNIWMSSTPRLTFCDSNIKTFIRQVNGLLTGSRSKVTSPLEKLEQLRLGENLEAAVSSRWIHNPAPGQHVTGPAADMKAPCCPQKGTSANANMRCRCPAKQGPVIIQKSESYHEKDMSVGTMAPTPPCCEKRKSCCEKGKGKEKVHLEHTEMPQSPSTSKSKTLPKIPEEDESRRSASVSMYRSECPTNHELDEDFDFDHVIIQRDEAAAEDDAEALRRAIHKLEIIKSHQRFNLGKDDPKTLITQREIVKTSLVYGWWDGKIIQTWEKQDIMAMENLANRAYQGLEKSLGPINCETMEALSVLLAVRISLVDMEGDLLTAVEDSLKTMKEKANHVEARKPMRLLHTLGLQYKVASTLAQISFRGDIMLKRLLRETDSLVETVDDEYFDDLSALRLAIKEKISEVQKWRKLELNR
ncbi:hypothetical protein F4804DRAFT_348507 [Jackrogersella minutella]|nr:hypothetical protein F4804DRAFT_348507 [Jackrogersella minutella]